LLLKSSRKTKRNRPTRSLQVPNPRGISLYTKMKTEFRLQSSPTRYLQRGRKILNANKPRNRGAILLKKQMTMSGIQQQRIRGQIDSGPGKRWVPLRISACGTVKGPSHALVLARFAIISRGSPLSPGKGNRGRSTPGDSGRTCLDYRPKRGPTQSVPPECASNEKGNPRITKIKTAVQ